jgi:copper(I)-binding protein
MKRIRWLMVGAATMLALGAAACSSDEGGIRVNDAWARSPIADVGVVYFEVFNDGEEADTLIAASFSGADQTEVHETVVEGGQAEMRPVEGVEIPAGGAMAFQPGGYHVMLLDLTQLLEVGSSIELTLTFERAGDIVVEAEVREFVEEPGMGMDGDTGA